MFQLAVAHKLASGIVEMLKPHCEKIHIAGSVRRKKPFVKDIEIACQPKEAVCKDMFGWDEGVIRDLDFARIIENELGHVLKGNSDGRYMQILLAQDINLDLFMPEPHDFYRQFAIRTGSADYSQKVIATGWNKLGWVGTEYGLRRRGDCEFVSEKWRVLNKNGEKPPVWESEEDFFKWLNILWIEPEKRY